MLAMASCGCMVNVSGSNTATPMLAVSPGMAPTNIPTTTKAPISNNVPGWRTVLSPSVYNSGPTAEMSGAPGTVTYSYDLKQDRVRQADVQERNETHPNYTNHHGV